MMPTISIKSAILCCAEHIESFGNVGTYAGDFPKRCRFVLTPKYKQRRDGILYYSRGHGWRVRRNPDWKEVFNKRFGEDEEALNPNYKRIEENQQREVK